MVSLLLVYSRYIQKWLHHARDDMANSLKIDTAVWSDNNTRGEAIPAVYQLALPLECPGHWLCAFLAHMCTQPNVY